MEVLFDKDQSGFLDDSVMLFHMWLFHGFGDDSVMCLEDLFDKDQAVFDVDSVRLFPLWLSLVMIQ